ncbi:hypothetical protein [Microbulbifer sp.]|uniref:hypothetical protein n=1 Tax=Microbulbifer sp. TaxID=1908541 RepID=UPI002582B1FC|nr:hypothetical protein [Microbulbifer sp.]
MRYGILLILLQSLLLCAEGRAESVSPQLLSEDKSVTAQLPRSGAPQSDEQPDSATAVTPYPLLQVAAAPYRTATSVSAPVRVHPAAHGIRAPPHHSPV